MIRNIKNIRRLRHRKYKTNKYKTNQFIEWTVSFLQAVVLATVLFFLIWPIIIDGSSMENTFFSGDGVLFSRIMAYTGMIENGDIIICHLKGEDKPVIKRIIASGGDRLVISNGKVYVNTVELKEPYLKSQTTSGKVDITLKDNEYYVLGDNRKLSYDSRRAGVITKKDIQGKVLLRWYPFNKIKLISKWA